MNVIFVPGFLYFEQDNRYSKIQTWKYALQYFDRDNILNLVTVHPSPVGSLHDRACQIFYDLKGGRTYFGEEHAQKFGHNCFGEDNKDGILNNWDEQNPSLFIGHSYGGLTIRYLEYLLKIGFFPGYKTSPKWITAVITLNSPLNGSLTPYALGERIGSAPAVWWGSPGMWLSIAGHFWEFLDISFLKGILDFRLSHWGLSRKYGLHGLKLLMKTLFCKGDVFMSEDNAAYCMTVEAVHKMNKTLVTNDLTYYYSICGSLEEYSKYQTNHQILRAFSSLLAYVKVFKANFTRGSCCPEFDYDKWMKLGHDGVLSTYTCSFPRNTYLSQYLRDGFQLNGSASEIQPGCWYWEIFPCHHNLAPCTYTKCDNYLQLKMYEKVYKFILAIIKKKTFYEKYQMQRPLENNNIEATVAAPYSHPPLRKIYKIEDHLGAKKSNSKFRRKSFSCKGFLQYIQQKSMLPFLFFMALLFFQYIH